MEVIYRAYDGTEFKNEEDCLHHEANTTKEIHAYDWKLNPLNASEVGLRTFANNAYYVKFDTEAAAYLFEHILEEYCYDSELPYCNEGIFYKGDYGWRNFKEDYEELKRVAEFFEENKNEHNEKDMEFYINSDDGAMTIKCWSKESFLKEISRMIDARAANGGAYFDITVNTERE